MGIFGTTVSRFIHNTQNPDNKYKDIKDSIDNLYESLLVGETTVPILDTDYYSLLDSINMTYYQTFQELNSSQIVDNVYRRVGFSPSKIAETSFPQAKDLLDNVDTDYKQNILELNQTYDKTNKDFNSHKFFKYLFGNLTYDLVSTFDFTRFKDTNQSFNCIFRRDVPVTDTVATEIQAIPYVIEYSLLFKLYSRSFRFPSEILNDFYINRRFQNNYIVQEFHNYFTLNKDLIAQETTKYIMNNIFLFGSKVDNEITTSIESTLSGLVVEIGQIFKEEYLPSDVTSLLLYDTLYHIISATALSRLEKKDNNIPSDSSFYQMAPEIFKNIEGEGGYYNLQEDIISSKLMTFLTDNIGAIKDFNIIALQYADDPLFFLNTFIVNFNKLALNAMQDYECFTLTDMQTWLTKFYQQDSAVQIDLKEYIENRRFIHPNPLPGYFLLPSFLIFRDIIITFCDSPEFRLFITSKFIPRIMKTANSHYLMEVDWYKYIDSLITFFKTLFMKHVLEFENGSPRLGGGYLLQIDDYISANLQTSEFTLTDILVDNVLTSELKNSKMYYSIFNSFFKSAIISRYAETFLLKHYSL